MKKTKSHCRIIKQLATTLMVGSLLSCTPNEKSEEIAKEFTEEIAKTFSNEVKVSERQILVNNTPYKIRGICYHPVPKGDTTRSFENLTEDLALMVEAGINTVRTYMPIAEKSVLDEINEAGIKVIIGFGYKQDGNYDIFSGTFIEYVKEFIDHPAILMWELGNEYNYHPEWFEGDINTWYKDLNNAADLIHQTDASHPVSSAHGELPDSLALASSPNVDVWGMNVYRWDNPSEIFEQWEKISTKPMYLSEGGGDSYMTIAKDDYKEGENEKAQADANAGVLESVFNNAEVCSGITLFSFIDGWWKAGNPGKQDIGGWAPKSTGIPYDGAPNEEFWGIVDINRNKKETFEIVKQKYTSFQK